MNIQSVITKHGAPYGVMIEDSGDSYPILMKALHVPMFFDELINSGWELHSLPYGFKKGDLEMSSLPVITHTAAGVTEEKEQFLMDTAVGAYKEVDLKAKMVKQPAVYVKWQESNNSLKTRAEMLRFLDTNKDGELDIDTPLTYMPLNSFVAESALFSPSEYFDPENAHYRKLIEDRRQLSLKSFIRMCKQMIKLGLPVDYDAKKLVDMYFSWGFCGMNIKPYDKRVEDKNVLLGAPIHSMKEEEIPYITEGILTYMTTSGEVYRPAACTGSNYKPNLSEMEMETRRRELGSYGYEYVYPLFLRAVTSSQVTTYMADDITVQYDENQVIFSVDGTVISTHTVQCASPDDPSRKMNSRYFNIINPEKQQELFIDSYLHSVARELVKRTITYADVSSYKAILASGGGRVSAFSKILNNPNFGKDAAESMLGEDDEFSGAKLSNDQLMIQLIGNMNSYLRGDIDKSNKLYDDLQSMADSIMEGRINIDSVFSGGKMDQLATVGNTVDMLKIAHKFLEVPLDVISKKVLEATKEDPYLDFHGKDKAVRINLFKRDMKKNGYIADFNDYRLSAAKESSYIHYVEEIYTELGPKDNPSPKHVAVKLLSFYKGTDDRNGQAVWKYVSEIFDQEIDARVVWRDQASVRELLPRLVSQAIFEAAVKGVITFPEQISGRQIKIDQATQEAICNCIEHQFDTTVAVAETAISRDGKFYRHCVNATIMDEYVIPNKGLSIPEKPFMPMWMNLRDFPVDRKKAWIEKGYIPDYKFTGFEPIYKSVATTHIALQTRSVDIPETAPAYVAWAEDYKSNFPLNEEFRAPAHYIYSIYPGLVSDEMSEEIEDAGKKLPAPVQKHLWGLDPVRRITRDDIFRRFPELKSYFEIVEALPPATEGVRRFSAYELQDFYHLGNFEAMQMAPDFGKTERPITVRSNVIYFGDFSVNYSEIESIDCGKYAVKHLCGRKYLVEDINGKLWEVVI